LACSARTAATRTSRSASSTARSNHCIALGEPISFNACTATARSGVSPSVSTLPMGATAAGERSAPARLMASSATF